MMTVMELKELINLLDTIYGISAITAMFLTIPLCIIWEKYCRKTGDDDAGAMVLFVSWVFGPIAIILYIISFCWFYKKLKERV